jgi:hypothetical protein
MKLLELLQLMSVVTDPSSDLHTATSWTDLNTYLSSSFAVVAGTLLAVSYVLLLTVRVFLTEHGPVLERPGMWVGYLAVILAYLKVVCDRAVLVPLLAGCLREFSAPTSAATLAVGALGFALYLLVVYPVGLYCSLGTSMLTQNRDRKFFPVNAELLFGLGKVLLIALSVLKQPALPFITEIFFLLYLAFIFKRPFYAHSYQPFKRAILSAIFFVCIIRSFNAITNNHEGAVLVEIAGIFCFVFLV